MGVLLGMWLALIAPAERQRSAVRRIEQLGGEVSYSRPPVQEFWPLVLMRQWLPRDYFDSVILVKAVSPDFTDADMHHIQSLPKLEHLDLLNTSVTDEGLVNLPRLPELRQVELCGTNITDRGVVTLVRIPKLACLNLRNTLATKASVTTVWRVSPKISTFVGPDPPLKAFFDQQYGSTERN
jgi:hypothetical protein